MAVATRLSVNEGRVQAGSAHEQRASVLSLSSLGLSVTICELLLSVVIYCSAQWQNGKQQRQMTED
jgi:hypothetical protein